MSRMKNLFALIALVLFLGCQSAANHTTMTKGEFVKQYYGLRDSIRRQKASLNTLYQKAKTEDEKNAVLKQARALFISGLVDKLFPYWYGTSYNFYAEGDTPRVNQIACGYFVAVLLRDMGAKVNIGDLAEGESGRMIMKLDAKEYIKRYKSIPAAKFYEMVKKDGDGLYIIGLDVHTGYLLCAGGKLYFIDAAPSEVKIHDPDSSIWLAGSDYRMTGKISDDPLFLKKWLTGVAFK